MKKICKNCKHWERQDGEIIKVNKNGYISFYRRKSYERVKGNFEHKIIETKNIQVGTCKSKKIQYNTNLEEEYFKNGAGDKLCYFDVDSYWVGQECGPEFGSIHFEEK